MNKNFTAYDVTGFLNDSIGTFIRKIEDLVFEMAETDDRDERVRLIDGVQYLIDQCNNVLR
jgi:hypothetical protein